MVFDSGTPLAHSPVNACSDTGFQLVDTLAQLRLLTISELNTLYLHFRYGRQFAIPLASHSLLPPCMQSSVPVCWLGFDRVGLTNLPTSAFVAHLQPPYNQKGPYLPIFKKADFLSICLSIA